MKALLRWVSPVLIGLASVLACLQFAIPMAGGLLTTNRLAISLVLIAFVMQTGITARVIRPRRWFGVLLATMLISATWNIILVFRSPGSSLVPALSWIMILFGSYGCYAVSASFNKVQSERLAASIVWAAALATGVTFIWLVVEVGVAEMVGGGYRVRSIMNSLDPGVNMHLTGLFVANAFGYGLTSMGRRRLVITTRVSQASCLLLLMLFVISGGRQVILALAALLCVLVVLHTMRGSRIHIVPFAKIIVVFAVGTWIAIQALTLVGADVWLEKRLIEDTLDHGTGDQSRVWLIGEATKYTMQHPIAGLGPGEFIERTNQPAHNSYLGVAAETGFVGLVILCVSVVVAIFGSARVYWANKERWPGSAVIAALVISFALVSMMLNDLSRFVGFWICIGIIGGSLVGHRRSAKTNHLNNTQ